jgi:uncharacterized protein (UPF0276 family)
MQAPFSIGINYEGSTAGLLAAVLPFIGHLEIAPDSLSHRVGDGLRIHEAKLQELRRLPEDLTILVHGVGLSIGSADGWSAAYLGLLDELFMQLKIRWHSEHLAYTQVAGEQLGTMLTLPRTTEVLEMICERVMILQDRYKVPFLLENVIDMLPSYDPQFSEAEFLNRITAKTGCGLIIDVYNMECDGHNFGFDSTKFLNEVHVDSIYELHLAGGVTTDDFQMDIHASLVKPSTIALALDLTSRRCANLTAITFEILDEFIGEVGVEKIVRQLQALDHLFNPQHEFTVAPDGVSSLDQS